MDRFRGKPLNSPNDVVVSADGAVWFTDPGYGIQGNYESSRQRPFELPTNVYRIDPGTGMASVVADDFVRPNGDVHGNVWCTYGWGDPREDGVRCYTPEGDLIGKIHLPETVANLTFGGPKKNRLFICASTSVYSLYLNDVGAQKP